MSGSLLDALTDELDAFTNTGEKSLNQLLEESQDFLNELKDLRTQIEKELPPESNMDSYSQLLDSESLEDKSGKWYKKSINLLKSYNTATNKFQKNVLTNTNFNVDLDEAYTFPLNVDNFAEPSQNASHSYPDVDASELREIRQENEVELMKAIISHLLKIGQCDIVNELIASLDGKVSIDPTLLSNFKTLNEIVDSIVLKHDLLKSLKWMYDKRNEKIKDIAVVQEQNSILPENRLPWMSKHDEETTNNDLTQVRNPEPINYGIEFKFHVLQFILLLHGNDKFTSNNALNAYLYAKENFPRFFKNYIDEISLVMTLLLFQQPGDAENQSQQVMMRKVSELIMRMKEIFENEKDSKKNEHGEVLFISEILANFEHINSYHSVFVNVANDFISEYCKDLKLSNDSSLFQSILAGFLNLPSFYKYNKIQLKLNKAKSTENSKTDNPGYLEAPYDYDIPFQLPDSNRFLFNYHPIFICPITKEQLVPAFSPENLHTNDPRYRKPPPHERQIVHNNPVVVLNFCQHLALKESVWQLSKKGTDIFKCHYCYKKHKFSDVTEAYFIDI